MFDMYNTDNTNVAVIETNDAGLVYGSGTDGSHRKEKVEEKKLLILGGGGRLYYTTYI